MSIKTIRKRIAITASSALLAGALSVVATPVAQAHEAAGSNANTAVTVGAIAGYGDAGSTRSDAGSLFVATIADSTVTTGVVGGGSDMNGCGSLATNARSKGLLYKDSSSGIAQSATVLQGAVLSFYSCVATAVSVSVSGGSVSSAASGMESAASTTTEYDATNKKVWLPNVTTTGGTGLAFLWTAPTTVGTYTVSAYQGFYTNSSGDQVRATGTNGAMGATLFGNVTVTVVATDAGGSYSATNSLCQAVRDTETYSSTLSSNVDATGTNENGSDWSIDLFLRDAYGANLPSTGALTASATNGALLAFGTAGTTPVAGTASTITTTGAGNNSTVRVSQATAGAPITTTVTISWNGTAVCTKTVSIAGTVAALTVPAANIAVQDLGASAGNAFWFADGTARAGTFYVVATDTVGNRVPTPTSVGTFSADAATLGTTVTAITFDAASLASVSSSSSALSATVARHSCASTAGTQKGVKIKFTLANGTVITSAPFDLSCADDPATVSASFDKAKYIAGDIATLTVSFKDTKGNAANNTVALGASTINVPGMTLVSTTGAADAVAKAGGKVSYTYTVGQTAGRYAAVVDFTGASTTFAQYATVQNPSYEISSGGDTTTNADVLKSIVALIASINKQIQALQKLILKR
jgi:hypothetical protein